MGEFADAADNVVALGEQVNIFVRHFVPLSCGDRFVTRRGPACLLYDFQTITYYSTKFDFFNHKKWKVVTFFEIC